MRSILLIVGCYILCVQLVLVAANPKCVPTDWTQNANYLDWGSCNWPNQGTPCGRVVAVPGKPKGQRAWPHGTCSLKFTRTPWAPGIYPQEKDSAWVCGTRFTNCTRRSTDPSKKGQAEVLECGGMVAGTERPCPDEQFSDWNCSAASKQYPNSNCKSDGDDLVLDVSTMGYPDEVQVSRVENAAQCAKMCEIKPGCNLYVFCDSPDGCGWSCQEYYWKIHPKKKGLSLPVIIGIAAGGAVLLFLIIGLVIWLACCRSRNSTKLPVHQPTPSSPSPKPASPPPPPLKPVASEQYSNASTMAPIPAGFQTTVGYPLETGSVHPNHFVQPPSIGMTQMGGSPHSSLGQPVGPRPAPRRFLFTGSSESGSEASSSIHPVPYTQTGPRPPIPTAPAVYPPRQQRGANHAVL